MDTQLPRILVAIDFSAASDRALDEAGRLARQMGAHLDLVHICPIPAAAGELPINFETKAFETARGLLCEMERVALSQSFAAKAHFGIGSPVFGILDYVKRLQPALIVVGSHGKGAMMRLLVGSVAESLIRRSPVPVVVVPAPGRPAIKDEFAWSCRDCGHILGTNEGISRCAGCGVSPAHWLSAPISHEPIDAGEPAAADEERDEVAGSSSGGLFATSPPGTEGYDVNPELRVRY